MSSTRVILAISLLLLMTEPVTGQHRRTDEEERKPGIMRHEGVGPPLDYLILAEFFPESLLVRGQLDLQYRNLSEDTITQMYLDLGRKSYPAGMEIDFYGNQRGDVPARIPTGGVRGYTLVDSILYRASRLEQLPVMLTDSIMSIDLPAGIAPNETGQLLVVFETRLTGHTSTVITESEWFAAERWFPRLVALGGMCRDVPDTGQRAAGSPGPARYDAVLKIDSAYTLIAPGYLLNEKIHYGNFEQSKADTVFADVLSHMFAFTKERSYVPTFESGIKDYYLQLFYGYAFPVVIAKNVRLDRAYVDTVPIEVYYPGSEADRVERRVAKLARHLVERYQRRLGTFPFPKLMIVAQEKNCFPGGVHEMIGIGKDETSERLLYPYLASRIAGCWFGDQPASVRGPISTGNPCVFASGVSYYVSIREVYDSLGAASTKVLEDYRRLQPTCPDGSTSQSGYADAVIERVAWEMRMLRFLVGDSLLWESIGIYSSEFRTRYPTVGDFERIVARITGTDYSWFFKQWSRPDADIDYYLSGVAWQRDESGVTVSGQVRNHGNVVMPVELAFVTQTGDTLLDTLAYRDFDPDRGEAYFSIHLAAEPKLVVLDPHHFLPDSDLDNNYRSRFGRRPRFREPSIPIPRMKW